jgi:hypothetical protein
MPSGLGELDRGNQAAFTSSRARLLPTKPAADSDTRIPQCPAFSRTAEQSSHRRKRACLQARCPPKQGKKHKDCSASACPATCKPKNSQACTWWRVRNPPHSLRFPRRRKFRARAESRRTPKTRYAAYFCASEREGRGCG